MKTLKITLMIALFVLISGQTEKIPSQNEVPVQEVKTEKSKTIERDLFAGLVKGIRVPSQS